jgi:hypothetical protein
MRLRRPLYSPVTPANRLVHGAAIDADLDHSANGRCSSFETYHTRLLSGRFVESSTGTVEVKSRLIGKDLAAIHWNWWISGDKNFDGTPRPKRYGVMTLIAQRHGWATADVARWRWGLRVSQR